MKKIAVTNETNVRDELDIQDIDVISDRFIKLKINDAANIISVSDELAERYLACFMIAKSKSWNSIKSTGDGVQFNAPDPKAFEDLYKARLTQLGASLPKKINWQRVDVEEQT